MNISTSFPKNFHLWIPDALSQFDINYLNSIKNDRKILFSLFYCAMQDINFWNNQTSEIKERITIAFYELPNSSQLIKNMKKSNDIYIQVKSIINNFKFKKLLESTINFINSKTNRIILDCSKLDEVSEDSPNLIEDLIVDNKNNREELVNFFNSLTKICNNLDDFTYFNSNRYNPYNIKVCEINAEILLLILRLSQRLETIVFNNLLVASLKIINNYINVNGVTCNKLSFKNINNFIIEIENISELKPQLEFLMKNLNYLNLNTVIYYKFFFKNNYFDPSLAISSKLEEKIQGVIFSFSKSYGNDILLNNIRSILSIEKLKGVEEIVFNDFNKLIDLRVLIKEISLLNNLRIFTINSREQSCLDLPSEIRCLTNLEKLYLKGHSYKIPKEIEELKKIKYLDLNLSTNTEINFTKLQNLEFLKLELDTLESIPKEVWMPSNIRELSILAKEPGNFKIALEPIFCLKDLRVLNSPHLTMQDCLKIFFHFSGRIGKDFLQFQGMPKPLKKFLTPLLNQIDICPIEKREYALNFSLLLSELSYLSTNPIQNEEKLDCLCQEIIDQAYLLLEIREGQLSSLEKYIIDKKLDYTKKLQGLVWLSQFLVNYFFNPHPLDETTYPTLQAICSLKNSAMEETATKILFSFYKPENQPKLNQWLSDLPLKSWQLLPHFFLVQSEVDDEKRRIFIQGLNNRYYQNYTKINPILEIIYLLMIEKNLNKVDRENILQLILTPPLLDKGRGKKGEVKIKKSDFLKTQGAFRDKKQPFIINVVKGLINLNKFDYLRILTEENLLDKLLEAYKEAFNLPEEKLGIVWDTFNSQRYPNGMFIYATDMLKLPPEEKEEFFIRFNKFIADVIEKRFPESRYNLSLGDERNLHLNTIFREKNGEIDQQLLDTWKSSFIITKESDIQICEGNPILLARNKFLQILNKEHLKNFKDVYPTLYFFLQIRGNVQLIQKLINHLENQLSREDLPLVKYDALNIEKKCLNILSLMEENSILAIIKALKDLSSSGPFRFKKDLEDLINLLNTHVGLSKFASIEDTNSWEDWLLMGTEVLLSCQNITDNNQNHLNKALLSYITDGKYKLIIVRDKDGKIAARSVLRLLWDEKGQKPVLFMEKIYTKYHEDSLLACIQKGCIIKAEQMGLDLVCNANRTYDNRYPHPLISLSSPAPIEYVDGLNGLIVGGKYTLDNVVLLYKAEANKKDLYK